MGREKPLRLPGTLVRGRSPTEPGEFAWVGTGGDHLEDPRQTFERGGQVYITLACPAGPMLGDDHCASVTIRVRLPQKEAEPAWPGQPVWLWDGDAERPTLNPSIRSEGACSWHGWLDRGEFRDA